MKILLWFILVLTSSVVFAQTQSEMNMDAYAQYKKTDQALNDIYQIIIKEYQSDTLFIANLRKSQRLWLKGFDADLAMKYPDYPPYTYGSIQPMCVAFYKRDLTERRVKFLKQWLRGTEQGDACSGSVKIVQEIEPAYMQKALISKDGTISLIGNIKKDYRIFGYKKKDAYSKKMILFSLFTNDVEHNAYDCPYGSYYDYNGLKDLSLKYLGTEGYFIKVAIFQEDKKVEEVYMVKQWFEFE